MKAKECWAVLALGCIACQLPLIAEDTAPPRIQFSSWGTTFAESEGEAEIEVRLTGELPDGTKVSVECVDAGDARSTATAGVDYLFSPVTLEFNDSMREQTVPFRLVRDGLVEGDERLRLELRNPSSPGQLGAYSSLDVRVADAETDIMLLGCPSLSDRSRVNAILPQPDGGAIVAGARLYHSTGERLWRLDPDGNLDPEFESPAIDLVERNPSYTAGLAQLPDRSILRLMSGDSPDDSASWRLIRHTPDGQIDETFRAPETYANRRGTTLAVDPGGRILVGGQDLLVRLRPDATLDPDFQPELRQDARVGALWPLGHDAILVVGDRLIDASGHLTPMLKLLDDGSVDETFRLSLSGQVTDVSVLSDGRILVAGSLGEPGEQQSVVWRLQPDGSIDPSFRPDAFLYPYMYSFAYVAPLVDGRLLVAKNGYFKFDSWCALHVVDSGGCLERTVLTGSRAVSELALLENGDFLVGGSFDGSLRNASVRKLARFRPLPPNTSAVTLAYTERLIGESVGPLPVRAVRVGQLQEAATARIAPVSGSATVGADLVEQTLELEFLPLEEEKRAWLEIGDDFLPEADEVFELRSSDADGANALSVMPFQATILDDDHSGALRFDRQLVGRVLGASYQDVDWLWKNDAGELAVAGTLNLAENLRVSLAVFGPDDVLKWCFDSAQGSFIGGAQLADGERLLLHQNRSLWRIDDTGKVLSTNAFESPDDPFLLWPQSRRGAFLAVSEQGGERFVKLGPDGTVEAGFQPFRGGFVTAVATAAPGLIYVGATDGLVWRLHPDGRIDHGFGQGGSVGPAQGASGDNVRTLLPISRNLLVVGGGFTSFGELPCAGIVALKADGSVDLDFQRLPGARSDRSGSAATPPAQVLVLAPHPTGRLWVGGDFESFHGQRRVGIVLLNEDGSVDGEAEFGRGIEPDSFHPLDPAVAVRAIASEPDGSLLVGGSFDRFNGCRFPGLVRVRGDLRVVRLFAAEVLELGGFRVRFSCRPGRDYELWGSSDLSAWELKGVQAAGAYESEWLVPQGGGTHRFYRLTQR